jgi:hypothetical protein
MRLAALALVLAASPAYADGFYYSQAYGVSSARGDGASPLGASLQLRLALGWRFGALTVGPLLGVNLAVQRDDATFGLLGGEPIAGDSDLKTYGIDARYHATLHEHLVMYVRGGPRYATGLGALDGYRGFGAGAGTGVQLTGRVRALGFLFVPLFFATKGPLITASVFLDENVDWYQLERNAMPTVATPIIGTTIGVAAGSHF